MHLVSCVIRKYTAFNRVLQHQSSPTCSVRYLSQPTIYSSPAVRGLFVLNVAKHAAKHVAKHVAKHAAKHEAKPLFSYKFEMALC